MMTCDDFKERIADALVSSLGAGELDGFEAHRDECTACRAEYDSVAGIWSKLDLIDADEPSPALRTRFYEMLHAYQQGARERRPTLAERLNTWLASFWPRQPLWQAAMCALFLAVAVAGYMRPGVREDTQRVEQLRGEVRQMRQLVTLALLQQQSPSERLRGVNLSNRMERPDDQVITALLQTLEGDDNVNVRLAAVDALQKFASRTNVRSALRQALPEQESPLVQLALVDLLVDLRDDQSEAVLREMANNPETAEQVKLRIQQRLMRAE